MSILNINLVPRFGVKGAAIATSITMFSGVILSSIYVIRQYNIFIKLTTLGRIFGASSVILILANLFDTPIFTELIIKFIILSIIYMILLFISGEISIAELKKVREILFIQKSFDNRNVKISLRSKS